MDVRGQISVELILLVGFIVVIVLVFASTIGDQIEQNNIASATRLGAVNATTEIGLLNRNLQPVRVNGINMTNSADKNKTMKIYLTYIPAQNQTILGSVKTSIEALGYTVQENPGYLNFSTSRGYHYNITLA